MSFNTRGRDVFVRSRFGSKDNRGQYDEDFAVAFATSTDYLPYANTDVVDDNTDRV